MRKEYKYPIVYAAMPMYEKTNGMWGHDDFDVIAYIPSKVYLLKEILKYGPDGTYIKEYEVMFPYQSKLDIENKLIDNSNCGYKCKVNKVFKTYEECKEECEMLDESIFLHSVALLMIDDNITSKIDKKRKEYNKRKNYYLELEKKLKKLTSDMKVNYPVKTLQKVLK